MRMKLIMALLQALLMEVLSYETCQKEVVPVYYYIYNTKVNITAYHCFPQQTDGNICERNNFGHRIHYYPTHLENIRNNCLVDFRNVYATTNDIFLCEFNTQTNIENIITLPYNQRQDYTYGYFYYKNYKFFTYWINNIYANLILTYQDSFNVSIVKENQHKYIHNQHVNLELKEKVKLSNIEVWKTNIYGIIATTIYIKPITTQIPLNLQSDFQKVCSNKTEQNVTNIALNGPKTNVSKHWYVYSYPTNVAVYFYIENAAESCEKLGRGKAVAWNSTNILNNIINLFNFTYEKSSFTLCKEQSSFNLETNRISTLPPICRYTDGVCNSPKAFWFIDHCRNIHDINKAECTSEKCTLVRNAFSFTLSKEGKLCGQNVWFTNQTAVVASEKELQSWLDHDFNIAIKDNVDLKETILKQTKKIYDLQTVFYYMIFAAVFCVLWYVFNVAVNCYSLLKLTRTRKSKNKVYLMNSVSQSLTNHYLYFSQSNSEKNQLSNLESLQLYVSAENELYNKVQTK